MSTPDRPLQPLERLVATLRRARRQGLAAEACSDAGSRAASKKAPRRDQRGVALVLVLTALTLLTVLLTSAEDDASAELASAVTGRDALKAEYAARSGVNLSRLLIAAEPTLRQAVAPLFMMMTGGKAQAPQLPVWQLADSLIGAFNNQEGKEAFGRVMPGLSFETAKNVGLTGAAFQLQIADEDAKVNINVASQSRLDAPKIELARKLRGLLEQPQYAPLFEGRDPDGNFSDLTTICAAIIDWTDPDQDQDACDAWGLASQSGSAPAEDSYYQLLDTRYPRKNAPFDSIQELRMVRGIGDDFWATFVEPDPFDPTTRSLTVWGKGKVNVNTANERVILSAIYGEVCLRDPATAIEHKLCTDPMEMQNLLRILGMARALFQGVPLAATTQAFLDLLAGKGPIGAQVLEAFGIEPVVFKHPDQVKRALSVESKVFTIVATGTVKAGNRETVRRVTEVVDFNRAPPPLPAATPSTAGATGAAGAGATGQAGGVFPPGVAAPADFGQNGVAGAFIPSAAGQVVYFRVD